MTNTSWRATGGWSADAGVGFGHETNAVTLVAAGAEPVVVELTDKRSIAKSVMDAVVLIRSHSTH
jgi:hypothetical protein